MIYLVSIRFRYFPRQCQNPLAVFTIDYREIHHIVIVAENLPRRKRQLQIYADPYQELFILFLHIPSGVWDMMHTKNLYSSHTQLA